MGWQVLNQKNCCTPVAARGGGEYEKDWQVNPDRVYQAINADAIAIVEGGLGKILRNPSS